MPGAIFFYMKRCGECDWVQVTEHTSCSQCGMLFVREATPEEKIALMDKFKGREYHEPE